MTSTPTATRTVTVATPAARLGKRAFWWGAVAGAVAVAVVRGGTPLVSAHERVAEPSPAPQVLKYPEDPWAEHGGLGARGFEDVTDKSSEELVMGPMLHVMKENLSYGSPKHVVGPGETARVQFWESRATASGPDVSPLFDGKQGETTGARSKRFRSGDAIGIAAYSFNRRYLPVEQRVP